VEEQERSQKTTRRMRFACWITKARDAHSEYELLIASNNGYENVPRPDIMLSVHCLSC